MRKAHGSKKASEIGSEEATHLEEARFGDDIVDYDEHDDDCDSDFDWQEAEVTLLPREEREVVLHLSKLTLLYI